MSGRQVSEQLWHDLLHQDDLEKIHTTLRMKELCNEHTDIYFNIIMDPSLMIAGIGYVGSTTSKPNMLTL